MDWYFESDMEDVTVPKDEEIFDRLPSPHSWSSWGNLIGKFNSQEKRNAFGVEELPLSGTMFSSAVEQHSSPSISQDSRHTSRQRSDCPHEMDIELDDLPIMDDADDIFFDSLFDVDARALNEAECSANCRQTSREDDVMETADLREQKNHIGDSIYDVENVYQFLPEKELEPEFCVLEEQSNAHADMSEEYISKEESVLLELQRLTVQMAKETRLGFRDSLYRLAENSRYRTECSCHGEGLENCKPSTRDIPSRFPESKAENSDTNAIDRTVATLLFDTMKVSCPTSGSTSGLDFAESFQREYQANASLYQPDSSVSSLCNVQEGDAEVPTFGLTNQTPPMWT